MLGKTKKAKPPGRLEQEEIDLRAAVEQALADDPTRTPLDDAEMMVMLALHKRMGEMIRHLQEIEGRSWR